MTNRGRSDGLAPGSASLVKESFAHIEPIADKAISYFYGRLFALDPELRALFPLAMDRQREHFFRMLARIVWSLDCTEELTAFLQQLGRDHRRYGVHAKHYPEFTDALLHTLRDLIGPGWTDEVAAAWAATLGMVSATMTEAAAADARVAPSWWLAEVTGHQRREADLAVLTVRPDQALSYRPGQYLSVQSARWPREWRNYSVANAPRPDGTLDLHVRAVPGGLVSTALVHHTIPGETLLLGPAQGAMTVPPESQRDVFCIAGGTGLAPVKAVIEQVVGIAAGPGPGGPAVTLLFGARTEAGLYDLRDLRRMAAWAPSLEVITAVSDDPGFGGPRGTLPEIVQQHAAGVAEAEVYLSGPPVMVRRTQAVLAHLGVPSGRLHFDEPDPDPDLDEPA